MTKRPLTDGAGPSRPAKRVRFADETQTSSAADTGVPEEPSLYHLDPRAFVPPSMFADEAEDFVESGHDTAVLKKHAQIRKQHGNAVEQPRSVLKHAHKSQPGPSQGGGGGGVPPRPPPESPEEDNSDDTNENVPPTPVHNKRKRKRSRSRTDSKKRVRIKRMSLEDVRAKLRVRDTENIIPVRYTHTPERVMEGMRYLEEKRNSSIRKLIVNRVDYMLHGSSNDELTTGFRRMDAYVDVLTRIDIESKQPRTYQQRVGSQRMLRAFTPKMFGRNFTNYMSAIRRRENWKRIVTTVAVSMARRTGKTTVVARNAVAALITIPRAKIGIFSPSGRQSIMMAAAIEEALTYIPEWHSRVIVRNKETMVIKGDQGEDDLREITMYPCNEQIDTGRCLRYPLPRLRSRTGQGLISGSCRMFCMSYTMPPTGISISKKQRYVGVLVFHFLFVLYPEEPPTGLWLDNNRRKCIIILSVPLLVNPLGK